jgi:hypothetical protein
MNQSKYPRVHLAIDNCFAIKRWPRPHEWARVIKEDIGGIFCVEASTDLEIDPQFCNREYINQWIDEAKFCESKYDTKITSFYSGYVTYRSVSLLNWSKLYREQFLSNYVYATIDLAKEFDALAGGTLQAFSDDILQSPTKFLEAEKMLNDYAILCSEYANKKGVIYGFEQMYTPTQGWWRINDVKKYLREIYSVSQSPLYTTIDTAHMAGQHLFHYPTDQMLRTMSLNRSCSGCNIPDEVKKMIESGSDYEDIKTCIEKYPYWFSEREDSDVYRWLEELACYSPIMHLQQTNGSYSSHKPFTKKYNENGIIKPKEVLESIVKCYDQPVDFKMPPRVKDIYLSFELFFGVTDSKYEIIDAMKESVAYWRNIISEDGQSADTWL